MSTVTEPEGELFDGAQYQLPIPTLDGHRADVLRVAVGGGLDLDLYDEAALAWLESLKLGRELDLNVTVRVTSSSWRHALKGEDGSDNVIHQLGLKVVGVQIPDEAA